MSIDLYSFVRSAATLVALVIVALGLVRAVQMGRGFVNRLYRGRAHWTAAVMLLTIISLSISSIYGNGLGLVSTIPFAILVLVMFVFADRTIQVAVEMDFFHRNTLRWRLVRKLLYVNRCSILSWHRQCLDCFRSMIRCTAWKSVSEMSGSVMTCFRMISLGARITLRRSPCRPFAVG